MFELFEICLAILNGPVWLEDLLEESASEQIKQRDNVIKAAIDYCKVRMDISSVPYSKEARESCLEAHSLDEFIELFEIYWSNDISVMAAPWVEDLFTTLTRQQLGDVACFLAYQRAMSAR